MESVCVCSIFCVLNDSVLKYRAFPRAVAL
jgi:hypothetical protein